MTAHPRGRGPSGAVIRRLSAGIAAALAGTALVWTLAPPTEAAAATACDPEPGFTHCLAFDFTGADQNFTVPAGAGPLDVAAWGAGGAGRNGVRGGGGGGYTHATYAVADGTELRLVVGGAGGSNTWAATYGGGGAAGLGPNFGGAGGGMSGVFVADAPVVVAGGGGGSSVRASGTTTTNAGGGGGGLSGSPVASQTSLQGQPASQVSGGAAGSGGTCTVLAPTAGTAYAGGSGGSSPVVTGQPNGGGGGGGGLFGGGGGSCGATATVGAGGGGGGSGFAGASDVADAVLLPGGSSATVNVGGASGGVGRPFHQATIGNGGGAAPAPSGGAGNGQIVLQFSLPVPTLTAPSPGSLVSTRPAITGTAPAGTQARVSVDGGAISCLEGDPLIVGGSGAFVCTPTTPLSPGTRTATVAVIDPEVPEVEYPASEALSFLVERPSLALVTRLDDADLSDSPEAGESILFEFSLQNDGDVRVDDIALTTDLAGLGPITYLWPGVPGILDPGDVLRASARSTLTQADIDRGSLESSAAATGTSVVGTAVSAASDAALDLAQSASLSLQKTASVSEVTRENQPVLYTFSMTNTGNVTLSALSVEEIDFTGAGPLGEIDCPVIVLAPGSSTACTAAYRAVPADGASPMLSNTASASGAAPAGIRVASAASTAQVVIDFSADEDGDAPRGDLATTGGQASPSITVVGLALLLIGALLRICRRSAVALGSDDR